MKRLVAAVLPALLISITALLLWTGLTNGHNWGDDFAAYIMQAQSVAKSAPSAFIEANRFTLEHSSYVMGPVAYPWGFPVLLAPVYALFGLNMIALKSVGALCFLLFLFLLWRGFRIRHSDSWLLVLLCLFGLNPTLLRFMNNILSDIPFLLVSTSCVLLIGRLVIERRRLISPVCDQLLVGAAIAAAFVIRTNGILLLVTLGFTQLIAVIRTVYGHDASHNQDPAGLRRLFSQKHDAVRHLVLYILPYASFVSLVLVWRAFLPSGSLSPQTSVLRGVSIEAIKQNVHYYIDVPAEFFEGVPHDRLNYGASIPLAIAGAITRYRTDFHAIAYVALTFLLYILWPPTSGLRFVLPVLPFYVSFALSCLEEYAVGMPRPLRALKTAVCVFPIVLILLYFGARSASDAAANMARHRAEVTGPFVETSRSMFSYIRENTDAGSRVVFFKPRAMMMMTGRRSLKTYNVRDLSGADYVVYQPAEVSDQILLPDEVRCMTENGIIQSVYKNRDFIVYRLTEPFKNALHTDGGCASLHPAWP